MKAKASLRYLRITPRKVRVVAISSAQERERGPGQLPTWKAPAEPLPSSCAAGGQRRAVAKDQSLDVDRLREGADVTRPLARRYMPRAMAAPQVLKKTTTSNYALDEMPKKRRAEAWSESQSDRFRLAHPSWDPSVRGEELRALAHETSAAQYVRRSWSGRISKSRSAPASK